MTEAREKDSPTQSAHEGQPLPDDGENLRKVYELTCARHSAIDDFRGKLLALLPIGSAAAGLLLLTKPTEIKPYATVMGLYGCAVTVRYWSVPRPNASRRPRHIRSHQWNLDQGPGSPGPGPCNGGRDSRAAVEV
jgi:hypothetical protein